MNIITEHFCLRTATASIEISESQSDKTNLRNQSKEADGKAGATV